jgi:hypothetical protein
MKTLKNIKDDLHHVFIDGDAKSQQLARVLVILDIPLLFAVLIFCRFI